MKEGRWREGVAERCDPWEIQGKAEVAFSVRDLSKRLSGRKTLFILARTTFDAVKSIPSAHTCSRTRHSATLPGRAGTSVIFSQLPSGVCEVSLAYSHQMAPALSGEGSSVTC